MAILRRRAIVSGSVQGVGFRAWTKACANDLGLAGWVKNLPDARVEAVFEGEESVVTKMLQILRKGPPASEVDNVEISEEPVKGEGSWFYIAR